MRAILVLSSFVVACSSTSGGATKPTPETGCPAGQVGVYEGAGCDGSNFKCIVVDGPDACTALAFFCGCDGLPHGGTCGATAQSFPYIGGEAESAETACASAPDTGGSDVMDSGLSDATSLCDAGETAFYDGPGCDGTNLKCWVVAGVDACSAILEYCGCDGVTHTGDCAATQRFPYKSAGACPTDGGGD